MRTPFDLHVLSLLVVALGATIASTASVQGRGSLQNHLAPEQPALVDSLDPEYDTSGETTDSTLPELSHNHGLPGGEINYLKNTPLIKLSGEYRNNAEKAISALFRISSGKHGIEPEILNKGVDRDARKAFVVKWSILTERLEKELLAQAYNLRNIQKDSRVQMSDGIRNAHALLLVIPTVHQNLIRKLRPKAQATDLLGDYPQHEPKVVRLAKKYFTSELITSYKLNPQQQALLLTSDVFQTLSLVNKAILRAKLMFNMQHISNALDQLYNKINDPSGRVRKGLPLGPVKLADLIGWLKGVAYIPSAELDKSFLEIQTLMNNKIERLTAVYELLWEHANAGGEGSTRHINLAKGMKNLALLLRNEIYRQKESLEEEIDQIRQAHLSFHKKVKARYMIHD
ncbi:MAG: hypothetical protein DHS80DRAFT_24284 [Piptocephalis tieghemiana]|nr:MAG: hypothetical protein DHS80DRAFT_24284 [Piptocephalis tieghemiana]